MDDEYNLLYNIKKKKVEKYTKYEVLDKLYYLECRLPEENEISHELAYDELIIKIKNSISTIEEKVPLYDIYTENIYLINKFNVYHRVVYQNYRFPEKYIINEFVEKLDNYNKIKKIDDVLIIRKKKKLELMINFMKSFDIDLLFTTYIKVYYKYSSYVGRNNTLCKHPSFIPTFYHLKPYLTRKEIINLSINFDIITDKKEINDDELYKLCDIIKNYQINAKILIDHQQYILNSNLLGLVQYYTLQGSHFMNQYLRNKTQYHTKNIELENLISPMWKLILDAPSFDKEYIFYRFVKEDTFLNKIKVGEIFTENGFMSTTRDPFYKSETYKFGFILIKIRVPKNTKGIALCLETISHFPEEQEIIFAPKSNFKLLSKDDDCVYFHTDENISSKVKTRYEFEWISNGPILFDRKDVAKIETIDFLKIDNNNYTLNKKIEYFNNSYVNEQGQFTIMLAGKEITVTTEYFNSTGAYKNYYAITSDDGYSMYAMFDGYILFFIELSDEQMHVNYFVKYSSIDPHKIIGTDNLVKLYSSIAYYFNITYPIIYANYLNCKNKTIEHQRNFGEVNEEYEHDLKMLGGSYCADIYNYLMTGVKQYSLDNILNVELKPHFSYFDLNLLKKTPIENILLKEDRDEIYQLYDKYYKNTQLNKNITDFYLWLIEQDKCYLLDIFIDKIDRIVGIINPLKSYNIYYILDASTYLYNRKYIYTLEILEFANNNININHEQKHNKNNFKFDRDTY